MDQRLNDVWQWRTEDAWIKTYSALQTTPRTQPEAPLQEAAVYNHLSYGTALSQLFELLMLADTLNLNSHPILILIFIFYIILC